jgi:hypothetical protein
MQAYQELRAALHIPAGDRVLCATRPIGKWAAEDAAAICVSDLMPLGEFVVYTRDAVAFHPCLTAALDHLARHQAAN